MKDLSKKPQPESLVRQQVVARGYDGRNRHGCPQATNLFRLARQDSFVSVGILYEPDA